MKVGVRKPSIKKSFKARTTGRAKRAIKSSVNPLYGKKGMGWIKNPERAAKNAIYKRTTVGVSDIAGKALGSGHSSSSSKEVVNSGIPNFVMLIFSAVFLFLGLFTFKEYLIPGVLMFVCAACAFLYYVFLRRFLS